MSEPRRAGGGIDADDASAYRTERPVLDRVRAALDDGRTRDAWELVRGAPTSSRSAGLIRRIAFTLRRDGYLSNAAEAFAACAGLGVADASDWKARIDGEIAVLSGRWKAPLLAESRFVAEPRRVLNIVGRSAPQFQKGFAIRTAQEVRAQRSAGYDPHVVTRLGFPAEADMSSSDAVEIVDGTLHHRLLECDVARMPIDALMTENTRRLGGLIARLRPSILDAASDFRNPMMALAAAKHFDIPLIYTVRGFWHESWLAERPSDAIDSDSYRWRAERELECMVAADHIVTLGDAMKRHLVGLGIPDGKISVVPNAVDPERFRPMPRDERLAQELGIGDGTTVIGYVSTFAPHEGIATLIDAASRLVADGRSITLLLVGDGETDERSRLSEHALHRGLAGRVVFTGRVPHDDVVRYYSLIDIFVVPRTPDRVGALVTPLKPYEAMACECAVVVADLAALREMIVENVTAMTFRAGDSGSLAAVIDTLVAGVDRRRDLGRAARRWVCRHRTWSDNSDRLARIFEKLEAACAAH